MTEEQTLIVSTTDGPRVKVKLWQVWCRTCRASLAAGTDRTATVQMALRNRTLRPCCLPDRDHLTGRPFWWQ